MKSLPVISACILLFLGVFFNLWSPSESSTSSDKDKLLAYFDHAHQGLIEQVSPYVNSYKNGSSLALDQVQALQKSWPDRPSFSVENPQQRIIWKGKEAKADYVLSDQVNGYKWSSYFHLFDTEGTLHAHWVADATLAYNYRQARPGEASAFLLSDTIWIKATQRSISFINQLGIVFLIISFLLFAYLIQDNRFHPVFKIGGFALLFLSYLVINGQIQEVASIINDQSYALSILFPSLLDLLFFSICLIAISFNIERWEYEESTGIKNQQVKAFLYAILNILFITAFINEFDSLVYNEKYNFNFQELANITAYELTALLCLASFNVAFFVLTQIFIRNLRFGNSWVRFAVILAVIAGSTLLVRQFIDIHPFWTLPLFLLTYYLNHDLYYDARTRTMTWLIWWIMVYSAFTSILLFHFDTNKEINERAAFVRSKYKLIDKDLFQESQLIINDSLVSDVTRVIQTHPSLGRIDEADIISYLTARHPAVAASEVKVSLEGSFADGRSIFSRKTGDVSVGPALDQSLRRNWSFSPLSNTYTRSFSFFSDSDKIINGSIGLAWKEGGQITPFPYSLKAQDSILFNGSKLLPAEWNDFELLPGELDVKYKRGNAYICYQPDQDIVLVTKKGFSSVVKPISLFSLFFCLFVLLVIIIFFLDRVKKILPPSLVFDVNQMNSLSTRIQLIIIGIIILSFISIVFITSWYLGREIRTGDDNLLQEKITALNMSFQERDQLNLNDEESLQILMAGKKSLEGIHNVDLAFYDHKGRLMDPETSKFANPYPTLPFLAYHHLITRDQKTPLTINTGSRETFFPIIKKGTIAIISLVVKEHRSGERLRIFDFLGTLLNVYVFLFLIAGAIAIAMARSITEPISTLAQRMKQITLGKNNESIQWKRNDELGLLINNYNDMLLELEKSAQLLAKTERDGAWREMAKQVAHEIKNPLTPMKLSIQYLNRAIKTQPENSRELVQKISGTLIEQIDNLSQIANSFSNFGELPKAENEKVVLNEVIETIHDLFRKRDDIKVNMNIPLNDLIVFADKSHLIRVLNNLVKNAIQAIPNDRNGWINIELYRQGSDAIIEVSDNGVGIPEAMKDKIFRPKFTTKSSGSGLGLAIATNMLESFNAKLDFESVEGKGSNFFITIPLMKFEENFDDSSGRTLL